MNKIFILLSVMVFLAAACGGTTPAAPTDVAPAAPTQTESQPTATSAPTIEAVPTAEEPAAPESEAVASSVSFTNDVKPIIDTKCSRCHGGETTREDLNMLSYDNLMKGSQNGPVISPGSADDSLFVQLIVEGEMPSRGTRVTSDELQRIIEWVNQGALNN